MTTCTNTAQAPSMDPLADFRPLCGARNPECPNGAQWIGWADCPACGRIHHLYCDPHKVEFEAVCEQNLNYWEHTHCGTAGLRIIGWERL